MPRTARKKSSLNIYHVMLRGINRQQLFFDNEDYGYFIHLLDRFKAPCGYKLHAYCLMGNHIHLLIEEGTDEGDSSLGDIFKHVAGAFVYWYNLKYNRVGHLFQDRFKSEPVNDNIYFRTVFRYILQNPVKAGFCRFAEQYPYSSAAEYLLSKHGISDTDYAKTLIEESVIVDYIHQQNNDECLEMNENIPVRRTDNKAKELILKVFGTYSPLTDRKRERQTLNRDICKLLNDGISIRQLSRLTGIPKKLIEAAKK